MYSFTTKLKGMLRDNKILQTKNIIRYKFNLKQFLMLQERLTFILRDVWKYIPIAYSKLNSNINSLTYFIKELQNVWWF